MVPRTAYLCGPTVHDIPHLGNLKTFYKSITHFYSSRKSKQILLMNITDINDKIYEKSRLQNVSVLDYVNKYTRLTMLLLRNLNLRPWVLDICRASLKIKEIKRDIRLLLKSPKWIIKLDESGLRGGLKDQLVKANWALLSEDQSSNSGPIFYLWRAQKEATYPLILNGVNISGIPGWHNECFSLIKSLVSPKFTHYGGIDLRPIHHENQINLLNSFKSYDITWCHTEPIISKQTGEKLSKSQNTGVIVNPNLISQWIPYFETCSMKKKTHLCQDFKKPKIYVNLRSRKNSHLKRLVLLRQEAKKKGDFKKADVIRTKLISLNYLCEDVKGKIRVYEF